jgi:hypothetical protein
MPHLSRIALLGCTVLVAASVAACAPEESQRGAVPDEAVDNAAGARLPDPVENIEISIEGCGTDTIRVVVEPWEAHVVRGRDFGWNVAGGTNADSVRVRHRTGQPQLPDLPAAAPGGRIPVQGGLAGAAGTRIQYDIIARCGDKTLIIDPDIVIRTGGSYLSPEP